MKRSEIRNAYDMMTPTRSQKDKMLAAILSETPVTDSHPGRYVQKQTHPSRFGTVAAAALLVCVLLGGMFVLGRMGRSDVIQQNSGAADWLLESDFYRAGLEWCEHLGDSDIAYAESSGIVSPYLEYCCQSSGDVAKLDEICERYGLKLLLPCLQEDFPLFVQESGIGELFYPIEGVIHENDRGAYQKEGYFSYEGSTTMLYEDSLWQYPVEYGYFHFPKEYFPRVLWRYGDLTKFECWEYTSSHDQSLFFFVTDDEGLVFAEQEDAFVLVIVKSLRVGDIVHGEQTMSREALEAFAETFDYSLTPGKVWLPEEYSYILEKYQTAVEQNWNIDQYHNNDLSYLPVYLQDPEDLGYCLMDLDGNGYKELLVGTDNVIFDLFTYNDEVGLMHLLCAGEMDPYVLCENNIIKHTGYTDMKATDYTFFRLSDGIDLLEEQVVIRTDDGWEAGPRKIKTEAVSEEEAMEIVDSYVEISLDYLTFIDTDSKVEEPDTTEPTFTDGSYVEILEKYAFAFTEDWDMETCQKKGISYLTASLEDIQDIGYTYIDLDGNGYEELIVSDGELIYDLYTRQNDGVISLLSSGEHNRYYLCENNVIAYHNSGRRPSSIYSYSVVDGGELDCIELVSYNAEVDAENPWFHQAGGCGMMDPITEAEANEIMDGYKKITIETRNIMRGTE